MTSPRTKALIDEAETLLTAIRSGVLVHLHDGVYPHHLKAPLDLARSLYNCAETIGDEKIVAGADALEAWLMLLTSETDMISHSRTHSLLDQISELEISLISYRAEDHPSTDDILDLFDKSFRTLSNGGTPEPQSIETTPTPSKFTSETIFDPIDDEPFELDSEMLEVFREESTALLQGIRASLDVLSERPHDREALWEVKRNAHTLKGAAGIVGLTQVSALAHKVEDLLGRLSETEAGSNSRIVGLLLNATTCLTALADGESSPSLDAEIEALKIEFSEALLTFCDKPAEVRDEAPAVLAPVADIPPAEPPAPAPPLRKGRIVRVSLDRLDDLVKIVRGLETSKQTLERHISDLERQLEESYNNRLRLQAASGKIDKLDAFPPASTRGESRWAQAEFDQITYELAETARDASVIDNSLASVRTGFEELYDQQRFLIERIQERLIRLRNVEFGSIATRLQRTIRVTCDDEGKRAEIDIENPSMEVDTQVIDSLIEPLMHLLKNAVVHGIESPDTRRMLGKPENGRISIRIANEGPYVVLTVADDGRGIANQALLEKAIASGRITREQGDRMTPAEIRELIFLPGLTTAEHVNLNAGRGVGMSIVKESLAASGGTISIETWPQRGTQFTVQLPNPFGDLTAAQVFADDESSKTDPDELKIFVVDDSPSVRLMTARTIQAAGWRAESAKNGIDALKKLTAMEERPHLILSDIEMPLMGGYEFLAAVRSEPQLKDIPVIIVSSRAGAEDRKQALAAGAMEYVTKPYNEALLVELIDRLALRSQPA